MNKKIVARIIIEILGSPKEHVEEVIHKIVDNIDKKEEDIKVIKGKSYEAEEVKGLWSSFAELDLEFKDEERLVGFCFDYMPSSIEILEPEVIKFEQKIFGELLNDLLARLHQYDMLTKNLRAENVILKKKYEGKEPTSS